MTVPYQVNLSEDIIRQKLNEDDCKGCAEILRQEFTTKRNEHHEILCPQPTEHVLTTLNDILNYTKSKISIDNIDEQVCLLIKQCFQSLRNCSANGEQSQNLIINHSDIIPNTYLLFQILVEHNLVCSNDCMKIGLQFLHNLICGNRNAQLLIWDKFQEFLNLDRKEFANVVALILYAIYKEHSELLPTDINFVSKIVRLKLEDMWNSQLLLELLITRNLITEFYNDMETELRVCFLDNIDSFLLRDIINIPLELILLLADNFKTKSDCILKTVTDYLKNIEPLEVAQLLKCITAASGKELYQSKLQEDKSLLINCAFLLKSIHEAGKLGDNYFSPIQKLAEMTNASDDIKQHPAFGFKADLVRLLANLTWKHKENQDMVRELDCIPVLMECSNIDARNPLLMQWSIFAIHNCVRDNTENQRVVASATKVGVVDSDALREMGLTIHDDGSQKITIAPLNLNNK